LRDARLVLAEIGKVLWLDSDLTSMADTNQPNRGFRYGGYVNDDTLIAAWKDAATRLLADADAALPAGNPNTPSGGSVSPRGQSEMRRDKRGRFLPADTGSAGKLRRSGTAAPRRRRRAGGRNLSRSPSAPPKPKLIKRPGSQVVSQFEIE
jgi:hypothetical protein